MKTTVFRFNPETGAAERIAVMDVNEETGAATIDQAATRRVEEENSQAGRRRRAYAAEADPFRDAALSYHAEAEALRLENADAETVHAAASRAAGWFAEYLRKKREIRSRLPDAGAVEAPRYFLTAAGTYHRPGCARTTAGEWMTPEALRDRPASAKPCRRCKPPAITSDSQGGEAAE